MTALDVHVNRVPTHSFFVEERNTPNLFTNNSSMIDMEKGLLENEVVEDNMKYLFSNERKVSVLYSNVLKQRYYIVQIADKDVDVIINWGKGKWIEQGTRFGQIRWGSQCDVIIPLIKKNKYRIVVEPLDHVEAGTDAIIEIGDQKRGTTFKG
jgi:phosphatidylserine decarboxylase